MTGEVSDAVVHRVRFPADPVSVPAARHMVRDALRAWGESNVAADALVVTSELATNAMLHSGSDFFTLELAQPAAGTVVIAVTDDGEVPPEAVEQRPADLTSRSGELTTGRGLAIVAALSDRWGVEPTVSGKRVWAALGGADMGSVLERTVSVPAQAVGEPLAPPPGWHVVRLVGCPVELSLRQDDHLDELIRDLQLTDPSAVAAPGAHLSAQMRDVLNKHAHARHLGRRTAQRAAAAGLDDVTVEMTLPAQAVDDVLELHAAVSAADDLARQGRLLLEPSSPDVTHLREWMAGEFVRQIRHGQLPTSYAQFRSA